MIIMIIIVIIVIIICAYLLYIGNVRYSERSALRFIAVCLLVNDLSITGSSLPLLNKRTSF